MCHAEKPEFFPDLEPAGRIDGPIAGLVYGSGAARSKIAIIPDIYGCSPFYRGLAARFAQKGADVLLINPFEPFGELSEPTRQKAFERRGKVRDREFLDEFVAFSKAQAITGVLGFCLGGLYVFELARRGLNAALVGLYGFPEGLPNQDPIDAPLNYIHMIETPYTMLMGWEDKSVGPEALRKLERAAASNPATELVLYDGVGHGFLAALAEAEGPARTVAEDALRRCEEKLLIKGHQNAGSIVS